MRRDAWSWALLLAAMLVVCTTSRAGDYTPFTGEKTEWRGHYARYDYLMDEATFALEPFKRDANENFAVKPPPKGKRRCVVVVPKSPAPGSPWSWRGCYWDHEPQTEVELLRRGFHVAFITPDPDKTWEAWFAYLTEKHGLSTKPAFVGMSRGGVNEYEWASAHPDNVACLYADNPAIKPGAFAKLDELAKRDIPLLNICGSQDFLLDRHTLAIESRYHQLGGRITVMIKEGHAHHPHSLRNPMRIADWVEKNVQPRKVPAELADPSFQKSSYYSLSSKYVKLDEEQTYATCRGPGFTECYDRFDATTGSPWGVTGMAVVVPAELAAGSPWVFYAGPIGREPKPLDLALLARGFVIVSAPIVAQSGPVREQWDAVYKFMTDRGLAKKAALAGTGTAAGEAYAWAIENPDKVACIYAENPALKSLMAKTPPIDNLAPLAKAGVPLIHVCGSLDPWLGGQTRVVEKRYKDLGGPITVLIKEGEGHFPLGPTDPEVVVGLIAKALE